MAAAAAAETAKPAFALGRRSSNYDYAFPAPSYTSSSPRRKLSLVTSSSSTSSSKPKAFGHVYSAGASPASSTTYFPPRSDSRTAASKMSASHVGSSLPTGGRAQSRHSKLHKRGGSGSSTPSCSSLPTAGVLSQAEPMLEESYTATSLTPTGSIPKIRPYLRKMSTKEDSEQGRLDLSKSLSETHALTGLGIQDLGQRSASEVSFTHTAKRSHARTISGDSTASGSARQPTKPFVHPMRQTPRPYTPPHARSFDSSTLNDEERNESDDVLTNDDFRLGQGFRNRRSVSISSTPVVAPTPLSQSHTAFDLGIVPKITEGANNASQTNLSIKSNKSGKSSKSRPSNGGGGGGGRSRRNTERSFETPTPSAASARTSFDKALSFASVGGGARRSDTDPLTRDQKIQAARRKFEEREEKKDRKAEDRLLKRRETDEARQDRQRRKSEASERTRMRKKSSSTEKTRGVAKKGSGEGREKDEYSLRPSASASSPPLGRWSEKAPPSPREAPRKVGETTPGKFSVWLKTRLLSCGGKG